MSPARAGVVIAGVAVAGAALLALLARAPSDLRAGAGEGATDPELGARFTEEQIAAHGAFRETSYAAFVLSLLVEAATLIALARGPVGRLATAAERAPGGWAMRALILGVAVALILTLAALPLGFVGHVVQRDWGLSTQTLGGWLSDYVRAAGISAVVAAASAVAFFGVVRWRPHSWWVFGWVTFSVLNALFVYLWPILVAPIFNKFEPLETSPLRRRVLAPIAAKEHHQRR